MRADTPMPLREADLANLGGLTEQVSAEEVVEVYLPLAGMVDLGAERKRLEGELEQARAQVARVEQLLANPGFTNRARPDVVERERARLAEAGERVSRLEGQLRGLGG